MASELVKVQATTEEKNVKDKIIEAVTEKIRLKICKFTTIWFKAVWFLKIPM